MSSAVSEPVGRGDPFTFDDPRPVTDIALPVQHDEVRMVILAAAKIKPGDHVMVLGRDVPLRDAALRTVGGQGTVTVLGRSDTEPRISRPFPGGGTLQRISGDDPLTDGSIQVVVGHHVLTGAPGLDIAVDEVARLLPLGGRVVLFEWILARVWHHPWPLPGMNDEETEAVHGALLAELETTRTAADTIEDDFVEIVRRAGILPTTLGCTIARLNVGPDGVDRYLTSPIFRGFPSWTRIITGRLGSDLATRYTTAWHTAAADSAVIERMPAVFLTATKVENRPDAQALAERTLLPKKKDPTLVVPEASWAVRLALGRAREHEKKLRFWNDREPTVYIDRYIDL